MEANSAQTITRTRVFDVLKRYDSIISQLSKRDKSASKSDSSAGGALQTLEQLDQWRLRELPETIEQRKKEHDAAWITKEEVIHLTRWKLKHGKFRPTLMKLVSANGPEYVEETTRRAFRAHSKNKQLPSTAGLALLCTLKGIGPATASLALSVYDPVAVPFFSDEAYRWVMYSDGKGNMWDKPIKYDNKSYEEYFGAVQAMRRRLNADDQEEKVSAGDVERVGYVLGKEADMGIEVGGDQKTQSDDDTGKQDTIEDDVHRPTYGRKRKSNVDGPQDPTVEDPSISSTPADAVAKRRRTRRG